MEELKKLEKEINEIIDTINKNELEIENFKGSGEQEDINYVDRLRSENQGLKRKLDTLNKKKDEINVEYSEEKANQEKYMEKGKE